MELEGGNAGVPVGGLLVRVRGAQEERLGPLRGEELEPDGKVLGEASVEGDSLRHRVRFGGKTLADLASGKPIRLRFVGWQLTRTALT